MNKISTLMVALIIGTLVQGPPISQSPAFAADTEEPLVEFGRMTWPEVQDALAAGKTTALFYTGGTEQRGPQNANGGHNMMGRAIVKEIALKLGNAIAMPVLPFTPNNADPDLPGTIGLTPEILETVLIRIAEQAIITGFKNVVLMGDHGGGQPNAYINAADVLNAKYADQGIRVFYGDRVYRAANSDFTEWLVENGYPPGAHGAIADTSMMMYLGGEEWVRSELLPNAVGDPVPEPGQGLQAPADGVNNGIFGDARRSSAELGKRGFDMKVEYAVRQIREFIGPGS